MRRLLFVPFLFGCDAPVLQAAAECSGDDTIHAHLWTNAGEIDEAAYEIPGVEAEFPLEVAAFVDVQDVAGQADLVTASGAVERDAAPEAGWDERWFVEIDLTGLGEAGAALCPAAPNGSFVGSRSDGSAFQL